MTNEEAIERLKKRICCEGSNRADKTFHFCTDSCLYGEEECEIALAIKALEKQTPKHTHLLFSRRAKLAELYSSWVTTNGVKNCAFSVITFLSSNHLLDIDKAYEFIEKAEVDESKK